MPIANDIFSYRHMQREKIESGSDRSQVVMIDVKYCRYYGQRST